MYGYNPRSIKKASDAKMIVAKFMLADVADRQVKLINVYKGVPVSHDATVTRVINDRLSLKFHHDQALLLNLEGQTYILSRLFPKPIKASVMTINTNEHVAILTDFVFSDPSFRKRTSIRVDLDFDSAPTVAIQASDSNVCLFGKLNDISTHGIGVIVIAIQDIMTKTFFENAEVRLSFDLPHPDTQELIEIALWGEIRHTERSQENYRLGIQTFPDEAAEDFINYFVTRRQESILEEIDKYSSSLGSGNWVFPG